MNDLRKYFLVTGILASPWLFLACGNTSGESEGEGESSGRSGICDAICERADECGVDSVSECVQACRDDDVSSSAALQVVEICAEDVTCSGFTNGDLAECVVEGISDLATSSAAEAYCRDFRAWAGTCLDEVPSSSECYAVANAASSGYLAELADCFDEDCVETTDCVEAVDSRYDAGDSIIQLVATGFGGGSDPTCAWTNDGECDEPDLCPTGTDTADCSAGSCCAAGDPCGWANDTFCDCSGEYSWDASDCAVACEWTNDGECDEPDLCPTGTDTVDCSTCPWTNDGVCDEPDLCPTGTDTTDCSAASCCAAGDPCGWANDTICDCGGSYSWDANDCNVGCAWTNDGVCDEPDLCPTGTDAADCAEVSCCAAGDPCGWASDGLCDCGGAYAWDANDCNVGCAWTNDGECDEPDLCPTGTDTADCAGVDCCAAGDPCGWANDGICDCSGTYAWDANDCAVGGGNTCVYANDGACDEPTYCDYGTDSADCAGSCCSADDPCGWAGDSVCDCGGAFAWDGVDCGL